MNIEEFTEEVRPWLRHFKAHSLEGDSHAHTRTAAIEAFAAAGFPTTKHEEWKYTSVRNIAKTPYTPVFALPKHSVRPEDLKAVLPPGVEGHVIALVDGHYDPSLSNGTLPQGLTITQSAPVLLYAKESPFVALNAAFAQNALTLTLARGKEIEAPVFLIHVSTQPGEIAINTRVKVEIGENAGMTLATAHFHAGGAAPFHNLVLEIALGADARLSQVDVQDREGLTHIGFTQVHQAQGSLYRHMALSTAGALVRNNLHVRHEGEHCETHLTGLYLLDGNAHVDNHTLIDHAQPNCNSDELYKGVLGGNATAVFNGKVMVRPDAQKTNAFQSNKTVLLSEGARINTKPQLEIFADDVKCSHGATTGTLDETALFYLRSRGLPEPTAKALLTYAFAAEALEKITHDGLRAHLTRIAEARLAATQQ